MNYLLTNQETERLSFRLLKQSDFDDWLPLFEKQEVVGFLAMDNKLSPKELCALWFEKSFNRYNNNLGGMNVLIEKSTGNLIGQCGLLVQEVEGETLLEIGYSILPKYWGKGFATEAAIKCKTFAFENNYANQIISIINTDNIASEKVALKNGMTLWKYVDDQKGMPANIFRVKKPLT